MRQYVNLHHVKGTAVKLIHKKTTKTFVILKTKTVYLYSIKTENHLITLIHEQKVHLLHNCCYFRTEEKLQRTISFVT